MLLDIQQGRCFYCGKDAGKSPQVEHFIPWARYPRNLGHNLVLADARCNGDKRETLPAKPHVEHWMARNAVQGDKLAAALGSRFICDLPTAVQVARWSYECDLSAGARLWFSRGSYSACEPAVLGALLRVGVA